jgi:trigger factor
LDTKSERLEGNQVILTVTIPATDVDTAIDEAYKDLSGKLRIPGFRKGKIPRPVIDTHVGRDAVLAEAQEAVVEGSYARAIAAEGLRPIENPDMGELDALVPGEPFTYIASLSVRPEIPVTSLDDLVIPAGPAGVSDADVDVQIETSRERFATLEVAERGVQQGDFALISFVGTVDGEGYEGNTVDKYLYETGRGLMPEEFDAALIGAAAGDDVIAEFEIPDTSSNEEYVGKQARFEITVHEVKGKVLPPLDDEFAASVGGFDTLDELRADIRQKVESSRALARMQRIEVMARHLLASRLEGDVPESMVQTRTSSMIRDFLENLEERKLSIQDYLDATGVTVDRIQSDIAEQAALRVREELALEAAFRMLGMQVTDEDVEKALSEIAGEDGDVEKVRSDLAASGATPILTESIVHQKALEWLLGAITVTEDEPAPEGDAGTSEAPAKPAKAAKGTKKRAKKTDAADAEPAPDAAGEEA